MYRYVCVEIDQAYISRGEISLRFEVVKEFQRGITSMRNNA